MKYYSTRAALLALTLVLSACGSLSHVTSQGSADKLVWPNPQSVSFKMGSFPNMDNLRMVGPGMTKDQIYNLLGRPHFGEGLIGVHEWNYLFHFRTGQTVETCEYKVVFDSSMHAQNFYWNPEACSSILNGAPAKVETYSLDSDVLFAFDSATLTSRGQSAVGQVAAKVRDRQDSAAIDVTGYTDRIGSTAYNQDLSVRRAQSVRAQLIQEGIAADRITAQGLGESQSVTHCGSMGRAALIACLAPDRRVVVTVAGKR
jgi:outer membrane protein OmpA-like peptidoglycan-associated protein